jgi:hypothetical protein
MYRVLKITSNNAVEEETLSNFSNAYRLCIPLDQTHAHCKVLPVVRAEMEAGAPYVLVTYTDAPDADGLYVRYYIQPIPLGVNTPVPNLAAMVVPMA